MKRSKVTAAPVVAASPKVDPIEAARQAYAQAKGVARIDSLRQRVALIRDLAAEVTAGWATDTMPEAEPAPAEPPPSARAAMPVVRTVDLDSVARLFAGMPGDDMPEEDMPEKDQPDAPGAETAENPADVAGDGPLAVETLADRPAQDAAVVAPALSAISAPARRSRAKPKAGPVA